MARRVIGALVPLFVQIGIFHEFFVNGANDLHRDKAKIVYPKAERQLA